MAEKIKCPYCGDDAEWVTGDKIYPDSPHLHKLLFYQCVPCWAWVGTHAKSGMPLGPLAKQAHRRLKGQAHKWFDPKWESGGMTRTEAYEWLAGQLHIPVEECHIGQMSMPILRRVIDLCSNREPLHKKPLTNAT